MGPPPPIARAPRCIIGRPTIIQERKDKNTKKPSTPLKLNISEPEETTRAEKREIHMRASEISPWKYPSLKG